MINESGQVAASRTGEISDTPAPRARFDGPLVEACGPGEPTAAGEAALARKPYVQRVGHDLAYVLWTAPSSDPMTVTVTLPDGTEVLRAESTLDATARLSGRHQHLAKLDGLEPSTLYCYAIDRGGERLIDPTGFRTAPAPGTPEPVTFVVWGDSGTGSGDQHSVFDQLQEVQFDLMLHTGDVAYDDGKLSEFEDNFFAVYEPLLKSFPMFPSTGNHDYRTDDAAPFRQVFALPENGGPSGLERWYSFDWGPVHFVALDTEKIGPEQADWLARDLEETRQPWIVVYAHDGPWSSGHHGDNPSFQRHFVPILEQHEVALVLTGHDHNYERIKPLQGVTYLVTGGGGRGTRSVGSSSNTAFSEEVLHFVWGRVDGDTLTLHAIDATGREFDSAKILRTRN